MQLGLKSELLGLFRLYELFLPNKNELDFLSLVTLRLYWYNDENSKSYAS